MTSDSAYYFSRRDLIFILVLIIFHAVGIAIMTMQQAEGAKLSYLNLLLCGIIVLLSEPSKKNILLPFVIISLGGYFVELVGIHTHVLFGNYKYGETLGLKVFDVPLIISLNWFVIVVASANIARLFTSNYLITAIISGGLCVLLDVLIEPIAIRLDYWTWADGTIPFYNYVCWFIFSVLFSLMYLKKTSERNRSAQFLFVIWLIFFTMLNLA